MKNQNHIELCADTLNSICCTNPELSSVYANILALIISKDKTSDQLDVIGNFVVGLGGLILLISAQKSFCQSKEDKIKQIADLRKQIKELEQSL